jgi:hypothetical protein
MDTNIYQEIEIIEPKIGFTLNFTLKKRFVYNQLSIAVMLKTPIENLKNFIYEIGVFPTRGYFDRGLYGPGGVEDIDEKNVYFSDNGYSLFLELKVKPVLPFNKRIIVPYGEDYTFNFKENPKDYECILTLYIAYKKKGIFSPKPNFKLFHFPIKVKGFF